MSAELPNGWASVRLGEIARARMGKTILSRELSETGVPVFSASTGDEPWGYLSECDTLFKRGTIVVTARGTIGQVKLPDFDEFISTQTTIALTPTNVIDAGFLSVQLRCADWASVTATTAIPMLTIGHLNELPVLVPPLPEQRRIVARIEALFARTRRARADLERIAPLAKRYRHQSLERSFTDLVADDEAVPFGSLISAIEAGKNLRCEERLPRPGERGIVKISAVTWGRFDAEKIKTAPPDAELDPRSRIAEGDFLLSRANTLELVGAPVIAEGVPPDTFLSDKVLRLRFIERVEPWAMWYLRSPRGRSEIEARSSGNQLSMRNIGQGALRDIPIPLPNAEARKNIVSTIEVGHRAVTSVEREASRALALLDRLEQSILTRAFRGELVPQDPRDEPASALLARLGNGSGRTARRRGRVAA